MDKKWWIILVIVAAVTLIIFLSQRTGNNGDKEIDNKSAQLPNPASVYCIEQGGNLSIREDASGGQYGVCILPNGTECEEWKYYNGKC